MILNFLRNKILQRNYFARQKWKTNNTNYRSNIFKDLKFEYKRFGSKNPNKYFYVIKRSPGAGFFSNLNFVIHHLLICDTLKMIPVIDMENFQTFYNCKKKINNTFNSWEYYFKPVSKYSLNEVYKSKNVIICDPRTSFNGNNSNIKNTVFEPFNGPQYLKIKHKKIIKKYIKYNEDIIREASFLTKKFKKEKILGICFRGSDAKFSAYQPHAPNLKQIVTSTKKLIKRYDYKKIYLCTEDIDYLNYFKREFKKEIIFNINSPRTNDKRDLFNYDDPLHRYKIGKGNMVDMLTLTKVHGLLFSVSNIPYTALFFSQKKIKRFIIDNGIRGGILKSYFSYWYKSKAPSFLGGFKNKFIIKNKISKVKNSDFQVL